MNPPENTSPNPMSDFSTFAQGYNGPKFSDMPTSTPAQTQTPQTHSASGPLGWLERNAQTIGSVALPTIADIVTGGAAIPLDPWLAGVGGAGGQIIKNKTTGTNTNPLEEGAISGALFGVGGLLGKGAKTAVQGVENAAPDLYKSAFNLDKNLRSRLNPTQTSKDMLRYGISGTLPSMVDKSTQAMDMLENIYRGAVGTIGDKQLDIGPALDAAKQAMNNPLAKTALDKKDYITIIDSLSNAGVEGSAPGLSTAQNLVDHMRNLQGQGHDLLFKGYRGAVPDNKLITMGDTILAGAGKMQSLVDEAAGGASVELFKTPQALSALSSVSPKLAEDVVAAKTPQDIRHLMSPFFRLKKMAQYTIDNPQKTGLLAGAIGGGAGFAAGGPLTAAAGMLAAPVIQGVENTVKAPLTSYAAKGVDALSKLLPATSGEAKPILDNIPKLVASRYATQSIPRALAGNNVQSPSDMTSSVNSAIQSATMSTPALAVPSGSSPTSSGSNSSATPDFNSLVSSMGLRGAEDYMQYIQQTQPKPSDTQQTGITLGQNALQQIKELAPMFETAISSGVIGKAAGMASKIPFIGGKLAGGIEETGKNTAASASYKAYEARRYDVARTLSRLASEGGMSAGGQAGIAQIEKILPTLGDSPQQAAAKFQSAIQTVLTSLNAVMSAPATNVPGGLANFSGAQVPGEPSFSNSNSNIMNFLPPSMSSQGAF